MNTRLGLIKN